MAIPRDGRRAHLLWTLDPSSRETVQELRDKIKLKMDVGKVLGGLISAVLVLFLDPAKMKDLAGRDQPWTLFGTWSVATYWPALGSAVLFLMAAILYLLMLYAYDRLLMPEQFWSMTAADPPGAWPVRRPPSSTAGTTSDADNDRGPRGPRR